MATRWRCAEGDGDDAEPQREQHDRQQAHHLTMQMGQLDGTACARQHREAHPVHHHADLALVFDGQRVGAKVQAGLKRSQARADDRVVDVAEADPTDRLRSHSGMCFGSHPRRPVRSHGRECGASSLAHERGGPMGIGVAGPNGVSTAGDCPTLRVCHSFRRRPRTTRAHSMCWSSVSAQHACVLCARSTRSWYCSTGTSGKRSSCAKRGKDGGARWSTGLPGTCDRFSRTWGCRLATSSTCGRLRRPGRTRRLCKGALHDCPGGIRSHFWRSLPTTRCGSGTPTGPVSMDGRATCSSTRSRGRCIFGFLGLDEQATELQIERGLMADVERFLLEMGEGFAVVGRQKHLEVGDQDFFIDLLLYQLVLPWQVPPQGTARRSCL